MATNNFSGFQFQAKDGGLVPVQTSPATDSVLIIGCAVDGPINKPVTITNFDNATAVFGPVVYTTSYPSMRAVGSGTSMVDPMRGRYNGNSLVKAAYEALQGGSGDLRLCRIGGIAATGASSGAGAAGSNLGISGVATSGTTFAALATAPGRIYNNLIASFGVKNAIPTANITVTGAAGPSGAAPAGIYNVIVEATVNGLVTQSYEQFATLPASGVLTVVFTPVAANVLHRIFIRPTGVLYNDPTGSLITGTPPGTGSISITFQGTSAGVFTQTTTSATSNTTIFPASGGVSTLPSAVWGWSISQPTVKGGACFVPVNIWNGNQVQDAIGALTSAGVNRTFTITTSTTGTSGALGLATTLSGQAFKGSITLTGGWDGTAAPSEMYDSVKSNTVTGTTWPGSGTGIGWPQLGFTPAVAGSGNVSFADFGKHGLFLRLQDSYQYLHDYEADFFLLAALYADDVVYDTDAPTVLAAGEATKCVLMGDATIGTTGYTGLIGFAQFINQVNRDTYPTVGVVGTRPLASFTPSNINNLATSLGWSPGGTCALTYGFRYNVAREAWAINLAPFIASGMIDQPDDLTGDLKDFGSNIVLFGQDVQMAQNALGPYIDNGFAVYAGFLSNLAPQRGATNMSVPGIIGIPWLYTREQENTLQNGAGQNLVGGFGGGGAPVILRNLYNRGIVVINDYTLAHRGSDYQTLSVKRIVNYAMQSIKGVAFNYIGGPNETASLMSLKTGIRSKLDTMVDANMLAAGEGRGYSFTVSPAGQGAGSLMGNLIINLTLIPALQIRVINVVCNVNAVG